MTRSSTDASRLHKTEIIETRIQRYLNAIAKAVEKNPQAAAAIADLIQRLDELKEETKKQMLIKFATAPLNRGTLQSMLNTNEKGEASLYTPLLRHNITAATANDVDAMGINDLGSNLANPEHRNQLGNVLTTKFQGVILPNIAIKFKHTPTKDLTPEQPVTNSNVTRQDIVEFFSDNANWEKRSVDDLIAAAQTRAVIWLDKGRKMLQMKLIEKLAARPVDYETLSASGQKD